MMKINKVKVLKLNKDKELIRIKVFIQQIIPLMMILMMALLHQKQNLIHNSKDHSN